MGLAMLGEERSMTTVFPAPWSEEPYASPAASTAPTTVRASRARSTRKFR